ncbi:MAG: type II toxin-antitoxin system HicA family toxin [Acidobacteria bacterium]|nr:type II toxin-antitoxin system HicA family toxin [Acidobacteriota bacterium]
MSRLKPVSFKTLARVFERAGFRCVRQEGDHMVYTKNGIARPIVIPKYTAIPVFIIKNNLRSAGISRDRYFQPLQE